MTVEEVVDELRACADEQTKKTLMRHGACEPIFGVKIEHLKKIQKRVKKDHELALALYDTGISDAMYLAGLIADDAKMTKKDLERWAKQANWSYLCDHTVPSVAAGSKHGLDMALKWIESKHEPIASCGWMTLSAIVSGRPNDELDLTLLKKLLARVKKSIHDAPNHVRYAMNGFVIALGSFVPALTETAIQTAESVGKVTVDMGDTACKVPDAPAYIRKVIDRGTVGKKRKSAKC